MAREVSRGYICSVIRVIRVKGRSVLIRSPMPSTLIHVAREYGLELAWHQVVAMGRGQETVPRSASQGDPRMAATLSEMKRQRVFFWVFLSCCPAVVFAPQQPPRIVRRD